MDINFLLSLIVVAVVASIPYYLLYKRDRDIINELLKKINEEKVVTLPWEQAVNDPNAQAKDDDHIPLDEIPDEEFIKAVNKNYVEKTENVDKEAEEAKQELN